MPYKPRRPWKPRPRTEADEQRFQRELAHRSHVRRLTREAMRAAYSAGPRPAATLALSREAA